MKPEDRIHRSPGRNGGPNTTGDRPPLLLRHLGKGARVKLYCGACAWSKSYEPRRLIARLKEKAAGGEATAIAHVARFVQWPCPACRRMAWVTQPEPPAPHPTSPIAAAMAGGGPLAERSEERGVEGASPTHSAHRFARSPSPRPGDRSPETPTRTLITKRARALGKEMSEPEVMLWSRLRGRTPDRPTFRRQHAIGSIIVDFFCPSALLAIEVDGRTHWDDAARARDAARDRWLASQGIAVLRIPAGEIYRDLRAVTDRIVLRAEMLRSVTPGRRLSPSTTPSAGRGPPPAAVPRRGR